VERDRFITVLDRRGYFCAFGMDLGKANKPAAAAPGVNPEELNSKTKTTAIADEGRWTGLRSMPPVTRLPADKMAYVRPAAGHDCVVMCSIHKNDGSPGAARLQLARTHPAFGCRRQQGKHLPKCRS
jgi:hypothetical protein